MNRSLLPSRIVLACLGVGVLFSVSQAQSWQDHAPVPIPITNNAVTTHALAGTTFVYTFFGMDSTKTWSGITTAAARLNTVTDTWEVLPDVPASEGVIAASAVTLGDSLYVLGGYRVSSTGQETTRRQVWVFDPAAGSWVDGAAFIPVKVDDMVAAAWRDTHLFLVSGWSQTGNVRLVQVWEAATNTWSQATPIPDFGTFGAVGGICGDHIVYMDGVADTSLFGFDATNRVLVGTINPGDPTDVTWEDRGPHPGPGVYRGASWNLPGDGTRILVAGGTDNPYNFDGIGYDGNPSEPLPDVWSYHVPSGTVVFHANKPTPTMDHRGFPAGNGSMFVVGGMEAGQIVTDRVSSWLPDAVTGIPVAGSSLVRIELVAAPNPAREGVHFSARSGDGVLDSAHIYDAAGRVVRKFEKRHRLSRGLHWDLTNDAGRRVGPGVYWLAGRAEGRTIARSVTVVSP